MKELTPEEIWKIASTIWTMPISMLNTLFPDGFFNLFDEYSPLEVKKILHDAGYLI